MVRSLFVTLRGVIGCTCGTEFHRWSYDLSPIPRLKPTKGTSCVLFRDSTRIKSRFPTVLGKSGRPTTTVVSLSTTDGRRRGRSSERTREGRRYGTDGTSHRRRHPPYGRGVNEPVDLNTGEFHPFCVVLSTGVTVTLISDSEVHDRSPREDGRVFPLPLHEVPIL